MTGISNYQFGAKNNWRNWQWNRIKEKIRKPVGECIALYLSGSQDLDRRVAVRKGFSPDNLIAVDNDIRVVRELRANGKLAIHGDIEEVVASFPSGVNIDVLVADYCGVLNRNTFLVRGQSLFHAPSIFGSVIAVNLYRARSKDASETRKHMLNMGGGDLMHKGQMFSWMALCSFANTFSVSKQYIRQIVAHWGCSYNSYKTISGPYFDSAVMNWPPIDIGNLDESRSELKKRLIPHIGLRRQISAVLAVRTMRINGKLKHSSSY